jgi:hypothetical protein
MKKYLLTLLVLLPAFISCNKSPEKSDNRSGQEYNAPEQNPGIKSGGSSNLSGAGFKESGVEFNIEYEEPRKIYKILKEDMNGSGSNEIIILSIAREEEYNTYDYYNFDMVEVFVLDEDDKTYKKVLADTVDYSKECIVESLDGSSQKQMMIKTYTGGNNIVSSSGMFIYGMTSPLKIEQLKYFDSGDPQLNDIDKNNEKEILISGEYTGMIPNVNIITYIKDIYSLDKNKLVRSNSRYGSYFDARINASMDRYRSYKDKLLMGMEARDFSYPLYTEAVEIILSHHAKGDNSGMMKFWNEEKEFLQKNITYDEFFDLKNLITKLQPVAEDFRQ